MDSANLILAEPILPPTLLDSLGGISLCKKIADRQADTIDELSEAKKKQAAKDFESVLLTK